MPATPENFFVPLQFSTAQSQVVLEGNASYGSSDPLDEGYGGSTNSKKSHWTDASNAVLNDTSLANWTWNDLDDLAYGYDQTRSHYLIGNSLTYTDSSLENGTLSTFLQTLFPNYWSWWAYWTGGVLKCDYIEWLPVDPAIGVTGMSIVFYGTGSQNEFSSFIQPNSQQVWTNDNTAVGDWTDISDFDYNGGLWNTDNVITTPTTMTGAWEVGGPNTMWGFPWGSLTTLDDALVQLSKFSFGTRVGAGQGSFNCQYMFAKLYFAPVVDDDNFTGWDIEPCDPPPPPPSNPQNRRQIIIT